MTPIAPNILSVFRQNLGALQATDPALAGRLADVGWPEDLRFGPALDATPTAFSRTFGRSGWFARSGAPRVRERTLCEQFEPGTSNVILPSPGQGIGIQRLLERLQPCQAILVWEADARLLAVLLALHDFSRAIADRRLIFIADGDLGAGLVDYLSAHPELAVPDRMLSWPWISENAMQELSRQVEQAVGKVNQVLAEKTAALQDQFNRQTAGRAAADGAALHIVSLGVASHYHALARDLHRAAQSLRRPCEVFRLDRPVHGSNVSILNHLILHPPRAIISLGVEANRWGVHVPPSLPFITILAPPGTALGEEALKDVAPRENEIFVLGAQEDRACLAGRVAAERLLVAEVAVDPEAFVPMPETGELHVAIVADRPDPDPETVGIRQQSHQALWRQMQAAIEHNPLSFADDRVEDVLRRASSETGVKITDPELYKSFTRLITAVLGPSAVATGVAEAVLRSGFKFKLYGRGWQDLPRFAAFASPWPAEPEAANRLLNGAEMILYLDNDSNHRPVVFNALCAGRPVLVKTLRDDRLRRYPALAQALHRLNPAAALAPQLKTARQNRQGLQARALAAREYLAANHTFVHLLEKVLQTI